VVDVAAQAVEGIKAAPSQAASPPLSPPRWRLVDRLGKQIIIQLLEDRRSGLTKQALADRYGISLCSVKRLLSKW
jgi:DNA invertase Pin-like site-specific DNA recombinase